MKRRDYIALIMAASMMLASCGKAIEETVEETTEETTVEETTIAETTAAPTPTSRPTATPTPRPTVTPTPIPTPTPVPEPVVIENVPITEYVDAASVCVGYGATYPVLKFDTEDAARINAEVYEMAQEISQYSYSSLRFYIIQNSDTVFTILVSYLGEGDYHEYYPYVIDSTTGNQLTNARILEMTGVDPSQVHDLAVSSLQEAFNTLYTSTEYSYTGGKPLFVDGEINDEGWPEGRSAEFFTNQDAYQITFSEDTLNADMRMFPDKDGNLNLCSLTFTDGGPSAMNRIYDLNGNFRAPNRTTGGYDIECCCSDTMYIYEWDSETASNTEYRYENGEFVATEE